MNRPGDGRRGTGATLRVLAIASHPIQYHAPWFRALAQKPGIDFSVLYARMPDARQQGAGFGIAFNWDVPLLDGYRWQSSDEARGPGGPGFFATRIAHPLALVRRLDPDVVILTGWHVWALVQALFAAWWLGIPVLMRGEANALRRRPWYVAAWHRLLLGRCAAFLPIGQASRAFYAGYGIATERLFDAPYFVDNARFRASAEERTARRAELRAAWGIPAAAVCYCYAGKLEPKKRILDLLEALRLAAAGSGPPIHLLVVGTGELLAQAKAMARESALPVSFAGFLNQTEMPSAYVAADCLVLPSDHGETWGLVVNEAMACARPAIVSDRVGCAADLVVEGVTGAVFPFADVAALAKRLQALARDPARLAAMGRQAQARVLQGYSVEQTVEGTLRAIRFAREPA